MNAHLMIGLLSTGLLLGMTPDEDINAWTSSDGKYSVEASLVDSRYDPDQKTTVLVLKKKDGSTVEVPANRLSSESRQLATRILAQRRSEARRHEQKKRYDAGRREEAQKEAERRILPPLPRPTTLTVNVDDVQRSALVFPGVRAHAIPSPVLLYFHGFTGASQDSAKCTQFHELWPEATVVYPQGLQTEHGKGNVGDGWQDDRYGPWFQQNRDIRFSDRLIEELSHRCKVDARRIYATGHSNGGVFTFLLLVRRPSTFAAFGPVGCYGACVREAETPRPVSYIFGKDDEVFDLTLAQETLGRLLILNRCSKDNSVEWFDGCQLFVPKEKGEPVVWCLHEGGHSWPEGASQLLVRFFKEHELEVANEVAAQSADAAKDRVLLAKYASSITGSLKYEPELGFIGWWTDVDSTATWILRDMRAGGYDVYIEYASPDYGGRYSVRIGEDEIQAEATGTGGWRAYQRKHIGRTNVKSSTVTVMIKAITIKSTALMDVKAISLVPLE